MREGNSDFAGHGPAVRGPASGVADSQTVHQEPCIFDCGYVFRVYLECADLSALWFAMINLECADLSALWFAARSARRFSYPILKQSGNKLPHSKGLNDKFGVR